MPLRNVTLATGCRYRALIYTNVCERGRHPRSSRQSGYGAEANKRTSQSPPDDFGFQWTFLSNFSNSIEAHAKIVSCLTKNYPIEEEGGTCPFFFLPIDPWFGSCPFFSFFRFFSPSQTNLLYEYKKLKDFCFFVYLSPWYCFPPTACIKQQTGTAVQRYRKR